MTAHCRALIWLVSLSTALLPATAAAQDLPGSPREGLGVAVMLSVQSRAGRVLSVRVTQPVHEKVAFDFDVGWRLPERNPARSKPHVPLRWRASGLVAGAHMRWLPKGRSETGWSAALTMGARVMHSGTYNSNNERVARGWVVVPGWANLTVDKLSDNAYRVGGTVGGLTSVPIELFTKNLKVHDSNLPMFYAELFGAWVQR